MYCRRHAVSASWQRCQRDARRACCRACVLPVISSSVMDFPGSINGSARKWTYSSHGLLDGARGPHRTGRSLPVLTVFLVVPCTGQIQGGSALTTGQDGVMSPAGLRSISASQQKTAGASPFAGALEVVDDLPRAWLPHGSPYPPGSGPIGAFCGSLARPNAGCVGVEDRLRVLLRPPHRSLPAVRSDRDVVPSRKMRHRPPGDRGSPIQGCNSTGEPISRPVHRTQEGYHRRTSSHRPPPPERARAVRALPDGGSPPCSPIRPRGQLAHKARPQGRVLHRADPSPTPPAPALQLGGPTLRVSVPTVRPVQRPPGIHEADEGPDQCSSSSGHSSHPVSRRPSPDCRVTAGRRAADAAGHSTPRISGFRNQSEEVHSRAYATARVPRISVELCGHDDVCADRQGAETPAGVPPSPVPALPVHPRIGLAPGQDGCVLPRHVSGSTAIPPPSAVEDCSPSSPSELPCHGTPDAGSQDGADVVGSRSRNLERSLDSQTSRSAHHILRCVPARLGSGVRHNEYWGSMVPYRGQSPHQCSGIDRCLILGESLSSPGLVPSSAHQVVDRQHDSRQLHQPLRRHAFPSPVPDRLRPLEMGGPTRYPPPGGICAERGEPSGPSFSGLPLRVRRLAPGPCSVSQDSEGSSLDLGARSVRISTEHATSRLLCLEAGSGGSRSRCVLSELESPSSGRGVCLPTILPTGQGASSCGLTPYLPDDTGRTSMGYAAMVRDFAAAVGRFPHASAHIRLPATLTLGPSTPTGTIPPPAPRRMAYLQQRFNAAGLSPQVVRLLSSSWRSSTNAAYASAWEQWLGWCSQRSVDPVRPSLAMVLQFLADSFEDGRSYSTLNVYRSAMSATLPELDGAPIGQHPLVVRLLRGICLERPPQPRYSHTWDVGIVTSWLSKLPANTDLSLPVLSGKLAILMALTAARRSSDLHRLSLNSHRFSAEGVVFDYLTPPKQHRPGSEPARPVTFAAFPVTPALCVVECFREYLRRTADLRQASSAHLFLSTKRPHHPVTSATIARWIKQVMSKAGVDTSLFGAHSTRAASTSAAKRKGMSTVDIMKCADWSCASVFQRFYFKPWEGETSGSSPSAHQQFCRSVLAP